MRHDGCVTGHDGYESPSPALDQLLLRQTAVNATAREV